jgi:hypothetical protein
MKTPKRDRPEAGRPGQRERSQLALQGTKTSREAPDQHSGARHVDGGTHARVPHVEPAVVGPVVTITTGRARSAWRGSIDSIKPGGREAHDAEAQAKVAVMSPRDVELGEASEG